MKTKRHTMTPSKMIALAAAILITGFLTPLSLAAPEKKETAAKQKAAQGTPQPGQKQPKITRWQELDLVRRTDVQHPGLGFAVEQEIERGANQGAGRRNRVVSGTNTAEEIIGFENNDVVDGVVEVDLDLAENRQAKR